MKDDEPSPWMLTRMAIKSGYSQPSASHRIGLKYKAASDTGHGCPHPELELRGLDDCWSIACIRCGKRWCNEALDRQAIAQLRVMEDL